MKLNRLVWPHHREPELLTTFGGAQLVQQLNGRVKLLGGSPDDHQAAREWCSLFMHDLVFSSEAHPSRVLRR